MKRFYFIIAIIAAVLLSSCALLPSKGKGGKDDEDMPGKHTDWSDKNAPKVIKSKDIILFDAYFVYENGLDHFVAKKTEDGRAELTMGFGDEHKTTVGPEFLVNLQEIIDKHGLVMHNGTFSVTAGLPYEPTSFLCKYESGEFISFKENAYPGAEWMKDVMELFEAEFTTS
ncbi:MAG: hypothetical protein ACOX75_05470 [Lachnospiraceae bacterium]